MNPVSPGGISVLSSMLATNCHVHDIKSAQKVHAMGLLITEVALAALIHLRNRELQLFDGLVGETSCQLRTIKAVKAADVLEASPAAQIKLNQQIEQIQAIRARLLALTPQAVQEPMSAAAYLKSLIDGACPHLELSEDDQFLILAHLLYLTRDNQVRKNTNERNLNALLPPSLALGIEDLTSFVWKAKEVLSRMSINVLREEIKILKIEPREKELLRVMAADRNILVATKLPCSPCFFNMQAVLENIKTSRTPLILSIKCREVKPIKLLLCSQNGTTFRLCNPMEVSARQAAIVYEGICGSSLSREDILQKLLGSNDAIERFPRSRVMEVLLANAAAHPQYAGKNKGSPIPMFVKRNEATMMSEFLKDMLIHRLEHPDMPVGPLITSVLGPCKKSFKALQNLCNPVPLEDLATAYLRMRLLKIRALEEGLCEENPSLFQLKHIYANTVGRELSEDAERTASSMEGDE